MGSQKNRLNETMHESRRGDRGSGPLLENFKAIGFLINTKLGHHRPVSETPFKWHFAGGLMMSHF